MKPLILKTPEGLYVCEIPIENEPEDGASDREWWIWAACGVGASPVEAYNSWVKDWGIRLMKTKLYLGGQLVLEKEQRPQSEWVIDPVFLEGIGDDSKLVGLIEDYFNWEEADWSENRLFYEYDLEHLEELNKRERRPTKEKM